MTQLLSKIERDSLGIDTLSRAIIYACLALEIATDGNTTLAEKVLVRTTDASGTDTVNTNFIAFVELPLKRVDALKDGFKLIENIDILTAANAPQFVTSNPTNPLPTNPLPVEPVEVDTLEKYLYWCCSILAASVAPDLSYVTRSFNEDGTGIILNIALPLNYQKTLLGATTLEASINFVTAYVTDIDQLNDDWTIPPSQQYWKDPVSDIAALKAIDNLPIGANVPVLSKAAVYLLVAELPDGETADDDLWIEPTSQTASEVWRKTIGIKGDKGDKGDPGAGITWRGIWNNAIAYVAQDAIDYQGSSYIANAPNTNKNPTSSPEWDLWVSKGEPGEGTPGQSAYQIAVTNGFSGTVAQWLASLEGDPGESAYELAVSLGFSGTEQAWLDSLKGAKGDIGPAGTVNAASGLILDLTGEPLTPSTGKLIIYASALDGLIYKKDDQGVVTEIGTGGGGSGGGREVLTSDRTYYVDSDPLIGSDSNNGLTSNTPFLTIAKAVAVRRTIDANGYKVKIQLANGTHTINSQIELYDSITITGNLTNPSNVVITSNLGIRYFRKESPEKVKIEGVKFTNTFNGEGCYFIWHNLGILELEKIDFGNATAAAITPYFDAIHLYIQHNATVLAKNITVSGNAGTCIYCLGSFDFLTVGATFTIVGNPSFFEFTRVGGKLYFNQYGWTIVNAGNASGVKYVAMTGGSIYTFGANTSFLPGNQSGRTETGGFYA